MFSGRRVGETERLKKGNFSKIERLESNNDGSRKLSYGEIEFLQSFRRILIRGKLNRTVPLLMTDKDEEAINLYMSFFKVEEANVDKNNPYVFALPGHTYKHQRACDNIRKYTSSIKNLKHPERLRGTLFRKNISTIAMSLNLSNGARTDLYDVLGHSGKINKNIYAQHEFQQQILTIAPILLKASTAVNKLDEQKCENDDEEEDIIQYETIIPDMNAKIQILERHTDKPSKLAKGNEERLESNNDGSRKLSYGEIEFLQSFRRILIEYESYIIDKRIVDNYQTFHRKTSALLLIKDQVTCKSSGTMSSWRNVSGGMSPGEMSLEVGALLPARAPDVNCRCRLLLESSPVSPLAGRRAVAMATREFWLQCDSDLGDIAVK
ncbi:hypothetical protein TSAR_014016 [Trichomalopsis sarcophagae]|uniref:Uncharacterized protein n=1 Tax=Trichomalopsis sarcophagae TaxID=543379 RepID=A0A232EZZ8_9HYME|nr:hypothetical protein TSAR_014016 [Trichomalopsis sarcophagae]